MQESAKLIFERDLHYLSHSRCTSTIAGGLRCPPRSRLSAPTTRAYPRRLNMFAFANSAALRTSISFFSANPSLSRCPVLHQRLYSHRNHVVYRNFNQSVVIAQASKTPSRRRMPAVLRPVVPTSELFQFNVEDKAQPRSQILRSVNSYVKEHNLQDPTNRRVILCDTKLKKLLGVDTCTHFEINGFISPYIRKPEDIGGRYLDEAQKFEELYLEQKALEEAKNPPKKSASKKPSKPRTFKPVVLSDELATICRAPEMPRPEVLKAVWAYIRLNNLQGGPGEPIRCDFLLQKVFNCKELSPRGVMKGISPHLTNKKE